MLIVKISIFIKAQRATNRKNTCKLRKQLPQFYNAHASNITTQPKKKRVANRKNACKLRTFVNAHAVNAHDTTKKTLLWAFAVCLFYWFVLWAFAPSAVKLIKIFSWFAGAFSICIFFLKLQRIELSLPPYNCPMLTTQFWTLIRI